MDIKLSKIARSRINNYLTGLLIIVAAVLLSWLSSRVEFQFDWTREGRHTLSEASKALLDKLSDPVHIVAYARDDVNLRNAIRNIIERYQRQKSDIHLRFVNPDIAPDEVRELGISAAVELILTYQGRSEHVQSITEQEITNALQRLARGAERWIAFIEGHGERNPLGKANHDLQEWGRQLQNKGFTVQPINLAEIQSIPVSTRVLVIAGPSVKLLPGELDLIATYIESGGNLLWLADPGDQHGLETIADKLDIKIEPGLIIDFAGRLIGLDDPSIVMQTPSLNPPHPAINNFDLTTFFPTATVISSKNESNWVFSPLISTGDHTWLETGKLEGEVNFDEGKDMAGPLTLGISLERTLLIEEENRQYNRDQRIIVIGDGDFLSNTYVANAGNMEFGTRIMNWLSFDDDLISIPTTTAADSQLQLSTFATGLIAFGFLIILPLALGATGVSIWWFRRKQYFMRSRLIINLLLIAVITVMAITLSLTDNNKSVETDTLLTSLSPDSVNSISILLEGEERSIFKRENDHWMMQKPYVHAANPVRINSMLNLLSAYSYARFDLEGLELSRFDLDSPRVSLVFNNTRIDFGSENPLDKTRYVMTGQQIHLINDSLFQQLQAPATFFLDTQLLPPGTIITGLSYPEHQVTQVDQRWMVIPEMEAETQPIEDLISAWQTVNAITLQPYIPREEVEETITVAREQFGNIIFDIVSPFPKLILGRADIGIQYHVSQENAGHLFLQPVDNNGSSTDETPAMEQPGQ